MSQRKRLLSAKDFLQTLCGTKSLRSSANGRVQLGISARKENTAKSRARLNAATNARKTTLGTAQNAEQAQELPTALNVRQTLYGTKSHPSHRHGTAKNGCRNLSLNTVIRQAIPNANMSVTPDTIMLTANALQIRATLKVTTRAAMSNIRQESAKQRTISSFLTDANVKQDITGGARPAAERKESLSEIYALVLTDATTTTQK